MLKSQNQEHFISEILENKLFTFLIKNMSLLAQWAISKRDKLIWEGGGQVIKTFHYVGSRRDGSIWET